MTKAIEYRTSAENSKRQEIWYNDHLQGDVLELEDGQFSVSFTRGDLAEGRLSSQDSAEKYVALMLLSPVPTTESRTKKGRRTVTDTTKTENTIDTDETGQIRPVPKPGRNKTAMSQEERDAKAALRKEATERRLQERQAQRDETMRVRDEKKAAAEELKAQRLREREEREVTRQAEKERKLQEAHPSLDGLLPTVQRGETVLQRINVSQITNLAGGDPVSKDLIDSVRMHGVLQPPTVRDNGNSTYSVITGKRRLQAAQEVGMGDVDVIVETRTGDTVNDHINRLIENANRSDNIIDEYHAVKALEDAGYSYRQIELATGMTRHQVLSAFAVGRLNPELMEAAEQGSMPRWAAMHASRFDPIIQERLVDVLHENGKVSAEDVKLEKRNIQTQKISELTQTVEGEEMPDLTYEDDGAEPVEGDIYKRSEIAIRSAKTLINALSSLDSVSDQYRDALILAREVLDRLQTVPAPA